MIGTSFLELLIDKGILNSSELKTVAEKFNNNEFSVLLHLLKSDLIRKTELGKLWGTSQGYAYVDLETTLFQQEAILCIPESFARKHILIPIYKFGDVLTVACQNPMNLNLLNELQKICNEKISLVFSFPDEIKDAIDIQYVSQNSIKDISNKIYIDKMNYRNDIITKDHLKSLISNEAIVEFTRQVILLAIKEKASDVHIEPFENYIKIRYRIDGCLQDRYRLDVSLLQSIVVRIKVLASLNITERRKPQDGRIKFTLSNRSLDFRVSIIPTINGEKIVLRVLGELHKKNIPDLTDLYFSKSIYDQLKKIIDSPNGVFFVTGPTGSGKTTTLYSILKYLNSENINIVTIEDPVEYMLEGINQVQVNNNIKLDFSTALRSFLRQDPDVILIGEIRDLETAKIASQAALTGHLVLATMHTNNSLQAVTRLIEIGVEPFLVAPSIIGVLSQRLVRKLCDSCKEKYQLSYDEKDKYFDDHKDKEVYFYRKKGCSSCNYTGYTGRVAIHEIFLLNDDIRRLIAKDASIIDIKEQAIINGFKNIHHDGLKKVIRGLTSIDEIEKVVL